jgi:prepilin-type processing-associated H-X9-DG protein
MSDITANGVDPLDYASPIKRRPRGLGGLAKIVGVIVIGGMVISVMLPSLCKSRETANVAKCSSNLHHIGLAISLYAQDNGGHYPASLAVLLRDEQITSAVMICPSSNDEVSGAADTAAIVADVAAAETNAAGHRHCLSYVYVGQKLTTATATATTIVAYEPLSNHQSGGTNVLFGDGHAEWIGKDAWKKMAADAGVAVVELPTTRR